MSIGGGFESFAERFVLLEFFDDFCGADLVGPEEQAAAEGWKPDAEIRPRSTSRTSRTMPSSSTRVASTSIGRNRRSVISSDENFAVRAGAALVDQRGDFRAVGAARRLAAFRRTVIEETFADFLADAATFHELLQIYAGTTRSGYASAIVRPACTATSIPTTSYSVTGPIGMPNDLAAFSIFVHVGPFAQQQGRFVHVRQQQPIHQKAGAVVHHDRRLTERLGIGDGGGNGRVARFLAANHLDERHLADRIEEMQAAKPLGMLQPVGQ